jgi:hypothetical protein
VIGESYEVAQDDPRSSHEPGGCRQEVCIVRADQVRLAYYKKPTSEQAFPVYVENIIVRNIQLHALPKQPDILQLRAEDSKKTRAPSRGLVFSPQALVAMECWRRHGNGTSDKSAQAAACCR